MNLFHLTLFCCFILLVSAADYEEPKKSKVEAFKVALKEVTKALKHGSKVWASRALRALSVKFDKLATKLEGEKEFELKPDYKPETEFKPDYKPDLGSEFKPETKPDVVSEYKPDVKPEIKPELQPDYKPVEKPELKPEYNKNIKEKEKEEKDEESDDYDYLDSRDKEKRPKRQVGDYKNNLLNLEKKMKHLNSEYSKTIDYLKLKENANDDIEKSKEITDRIEHLTKAQKVVDQILVFLKTVLDDPKRKQEDLQYLEKLYDVELKRIESARNFVDGNSPQLPPEKDFGGSEVDARVKPNNRPTVGSEEKKALPNKIDVSDAKQRDFEDFEEP